MITYHLDYRSPPSGLGTITLENKEMILIQSQDEQTEVKDGIYSKIIVLNHDWEDFENLNKEKFQILKEHGVTHVYDSEEEDAVTDRNGYMTLKEFIRIRSNW
jgi:hypothetical protein